MMRSPVAILAGTVLSLGFSLIVIGHARPVRVQDQVADLRAANAKLTADVEALKGRLAVIEGRKETPWRYLLSALAGALLGGTLGLLGAYLQFRQRQKEARREATDRIFEEWWSPHFADLRKYFFQEFVPKYRISLNRKGMKRIADEISEDRGQSQKLCFFFDKVGWLGAAGLIDVDYVLGPMQQAMRRCWIVMEPLIRHEREIGSEGRPDPVYQFGFEWLYERSSKPRYHLSELVKRRFSKPKIRSKQEIQAIRNQIEKDERTFRGKLREAGIEIRERTNLNSAFLGGFMRGRREK